MYVRIPRQDGGPTLLLSGRRPAIVEALTIVMSGTCPARDQVPTARRNESRPVERLFGNAGRGRNDMGLWGACNDNKKNGRIRICNPECGRSFMLLHPQSLTNSEGARSLRIIPRCRFRDGAGCLCGGRHVRGARGGDDVRDAHAQRSLRAFRAERGGSV